MTGSGMAAVDTKEKAGDNFRTTLLAGAAHDLKDADVLLKNANKFRGRILLDGDNLEEGE